MSQVNDAKDVTCFFIDTRKYQKRATVSTDACTEWAIAMILAKQFLASFQPEGRKSKGKETNQQVKQRKRQESRNY
jgi:hypothetical protein